MVDLIMPLKENRTLPYELVGPDNAPVPGFEGVRFSESSPGYVKWPAAVAFARKRSGVLQSAREAAAFSIHADGTDNANNYQATRTVAIGFEDNGKFYLAFDDDPDPSKNIVLARAQEGYDTNIAGREWTLPKSDSYVRQILVRAEKDSRKVVSAQKSPLVLPTAQDVQYFGNNETVEAVLGDQAPGYAAHRLKSGRNTGRVYALTEDKLRDIIGEDIDKVVIRPVGLGDVFGFVAGNRFVNNGLARGVSEAQNFSRGRRPSLEETLD